MIALHRIEHLVDLGARRIDDGGEDCFFVGKVTIERTETEVCGLGDRGDGGRFEAEAYEEIAGRNHQRIAVAGALALGARNGDGSQI